MSYSEVVPRQRGVSLIEVMVSLVIGLVVVGAVLVNYVGVGVSGRQQSAYAQMTEDAQIAFAVVGRDLMNSGYAQPTGWAGGTSTFARTFVSGTPDFAIFGCDTGFSAPNASSISCGTGTSAALSVAYEADTVTTAPSSGGLPTDCLGNALTAQTVAVGATTVTFYVAKNRYFVDKNTSTIPELYCVSPGNSKQPLIENVESMKAWYGVEGATARQVGSYVGAGSVTDWGKVVSVRLCLVMRSSEAVLTQEDLDVKSTYLNCDGAVTALPDKYARRAFYTTIAFRNRMSF
ncbi:MAG: PilW family protein [Ramlibacter sp.]|nr:PilW family protein [Ramlibacter sp.]MCW5648811.1 PilW family protein [Ramlibacter sp.]